MSVKFNVFRKEIDWGGRKLTLETGKIARQADAAVMATLGDTVVLATVVAKKEATPGVDFFPLTVNYEEKNYAAGKIPGGFFRREGKPSEKEVLVSRLIDRPIRPLFADSFKNETQVICMLLSHDKVNSPDILALVAASAALTLSGIPFQGPIGAARVGYIDGQYVLNPDLNLMNTSSMDLVLAGTKEGVLMVESEINELPEDIVLGAVTFGHAHFQPVIDAIIDLAEACAKEPWDLPEADKKELDLRKKVASEVKKDMTEAYKIIEKQSRVERLNAVKAKVVEKLSSDDVSADDIAKHFKSVECDIVRGNIFKTDKRIDGRGLKDVRPISCEVDLLPRTHGSALFTRGETQSIVVATLGTGQDEQIMDALEGEYKEAFMLHYNFPSFSVGEVGRRMGPGRREIGHGKLAWRAVHPLLPAKEAFPYTIRVVSEVTESNGSSSMATVCGTSLALMDAGVPLKAPIAGIAMGLIKDGDDYRVLSDILGDEDHLGDMDFKVAGTKDGITALQMDIKITSITPQIMKEALDQAREGRLHILDKMNEAIKVSREEVNPNAPRIFTLKVPKDKIREVIGTGGKVIRDIVEKSGAKVDIDDNGNVNVAAVDGAAAQIAIDMITSIVAVPEIGKIYKGKVAKIVEFGAFIDFMGNASGLVHISELAEGRTKQVSDVVKEGQEVTVKVIGIDDRGKVKLSMKAVAADKTDEA